MHSWNETFLININVVFNWKQRTFGERKRISLVKQPSRRSTNTKKNLSKQFFHESIKNTHETLTDINKNTSRYISKTITEFPIENNKAKENSNDKVLELRNERGMIASSLFSPSSKITSRENPSQYKYVKDSNSDRVIELLLHNTLPATLYNTFFNNPWYRQKVWNERRSIETDN